MKKGFTIIEVSLVLAVAGLIFLMVFVAVPSMQASQRDTQRRADITKLIDSVKKYQTNNRGALPTNWEKFKTDYLGDKFEDPVGGINYNLLVKACGATTNNPCTSNVNRVSDATQFPNGYTMYVVTQATCDGSKAKGSSNPRKIAVVYVMERVGAYCANS